MTSRSGTQKFGKSDTAFRRRIGPRTSPERLSELLSKTMLFQGIEAEHIAKVTDSSELVATYRGQTIMEEGEAANDLFLIVHGRVSIHVETISPYMEICLTKLGPGEIIGEMALFPNNHRFSTVISEEACELIQMQGNMIRQIAEEFPLQGMILMRNVAEILGHRLNHSNQRMVNMIRRRYY